MEVPCPDTGAVHMVPDAQMTKLQRDVDSLKRIIAKLLLMMPGDISELFASEEKELGL